MPRPCHAADLLAGRMEGVPEGDSVWRLARRLDRQLTGRTVVRSDFRTPRLATRDVAGRTVVGHDTHGKHLLTRLSATGASGPVTLHSHLRMDGSWTTTGPGKRLPARVMGDVRLVLVLDDGRTAHGTRLHDLELVPTADEGRLVGHLGPDPLRADWDAGEAVRRLSADPTTPLVSALLDQRLLAGLGNLWANELAFLTGVSPWTPIGEVDVPRLVERAATMLHHSATVPQAYQVTTGSMWPGTDHWVTGRQRRGCLRCGTAVRVAAEVPGDAANRRTWWCPRCQPGPGPEARRPSDRSV
jgi:endonuclease VIII